MSEKIDREAVVSQVRDIVGEVLKRKPEELSEDSNFELLGADSLDRITMVMALEDALDCEISDEDAKNIRTVRDAVDYVVANQSV